MVKRNMPKKGEKKANIYSVPTTLKNAVPAKIGIIKQRQTTSRTLCASRKYINRTEGEVAYFQKRKQNNRNIYIGTHGSKPWLEIQSASHLTGF